MWSLRPSCRVLWCRFSCGLSFCVVWFRASWDTLWTREFDHHHRAMDGVRTRRYIRANMRCNYPSAQITRRIWAYNALSTCGDTSHKKTRQCASSRGQAGLLRPLYMKRPRLVRCVAARVRGTCKALSRAAKRACCFRAVPSSAAPHGRRSARFAFPLRTRRWTRRP